MIIVRKPELQFFVCIRSDYSISSHCNKYIKSLGRITAAVAAADRTQMITA